MLEVALTETAAENLREAFEMIRTDPALTISSSDRGRLADHVRALLKDKSTPIRIGAQKALEQLGGSESIG